MTRDLILVCILTFCYASKIRESISKYAISRGMPLKFVKNAPTRIWVKCEDGCPFLLLVSKDSSKPGLIKDPRKKIWGKSKSLG